MADPTHFQTLCQVEQEKNRKEKPFIQLKRRQDIGTRPQYALTRLGTMEATPMLNQWREFHECAHAKTYQQFYSKLCYCLSLRSNQIDLDTFLSLLADRSFLFLEHLEHRCDGAEFPLLSDLVSSPDNTFGVPKWKREFVMKWGFLPTVAHRQSYAGWRRNLAALQYAVKLRRECLLKSTLTEEKIELPPPVDTPLSEQEEQLSALFRAYLEACVNRAYRKDLACHLTDQAPWQSVIHRLFTMLSLSKDETNYFSTFPGGAALLFFYLFTQETSGVAKGTVKTFTFAPLKPSLAANRDPNAVSHDKVRKQTRCNILLFDQLLELLHRDRLTESEENSAAADKYRARANYAFYALTRYDHYCHYSLSDFWTTDGPRISFSYEKEEKDDPLNGVDHLGNLVRRHIHYCIPATAQWLLPVLSLDHEEPALSILATQLMLEGSGNLALPQEEYLTSRIRRFLATENGTRAYGDYRTAYLAGKAEKIKDMLSLWIKTYNLRSAGGKTLFYETLYQGEIAWKLDQYVLEYYLRLRMLREAHENLTSIAKSFLDPLCFESFSGSVL